MPPQILVPGQVYIYRGGQLTVGDLQTLNHIEIGGIDFVFIVIFSTYRGIDNEGNPRYTYIVENLNRHGHFQQHIVTPMIMSRTTFEFILSDENINSDVSHLGRFLLIPSQPINGRFVYDMQSNQNAEDNRQTYFDNAREVFNNPHEGYNVIHNNEIDDMQLMDVPLIDVPLIAEPLMHNANDNVNIIGQNAPAAPNNNQQDNGQVNIIEGGSCRGGSRGRRNTRNRRNKKYRTRNKNNNKNRKTRRLRRRNYNSMKGGINISKIK